MRLLLLLVSALAFTALPGCGPDRSVEERVFACRDRWKDKDALKDPEQLRLALDCFTPGTRPIAEAVQTQKGEVVYPVRLDRLLDYDEATGEAEIERQSAIIALKKGRTIHRVFLELDATDNVWRIDLLELPRFWQPLDENGAAS